jgi:hypothetical protein
VILIFVWSRIGQRNHVLFPFLTQPSISAFT